MAPLVRVAGLVEGVDSISVARSILRMVALAVRLGKKIFRARTGDEATPGDATDKTEDQKVGLLDWLHNSKAEDSRPAFVIEVAAQERETDLSLGKLKITHAGCGGGVMEKDLHVTGSLWLRCERCMAHIRVETGEYGIGPIFATALDGTERWVRGFFFNESNRDACPKSRRSAATLRSSTNSREWWAT